MDIKVDYSNGKKKKLWDYPSLKRFPPNLQNWPISPLKTSFDETSSVVNTPVWFFRQPLRKSGSLSLLNSLDSPYLSLISVCYEWSVTPTLDQVAIQTTNQYLLWRGRPWMLGLHYPRCTFLDGVSGSLSPSVSPKKRGRRIYSGKIVFIDIKRVRNS